ncbi:hypothetical protein IFM89_002794 [Coptis chinensis]|uniref:Uncharacterized protein n=1 Tax=Coptis chinensis TaxID=261450 RepID=A0A835LUT5_9MAGN|nr:hypothetical protein IFM89_002794 [Coptis chinensis]
MISISTSVAEVFSRIDHKFDLIDPEYHQQTLANLKLAVMLDTVGPELQVVNVTEDAISLVTGGLVVQTLNRD